MTSTNFFLILVALQLADIYTTLRAIKLGAVETNTLVHKLMGIFGLKEGLLLVKIAAMIPLWVFRDLTPLWAWIALIVFYVAVIWNNLGVIRKLKEKKSA